MSRSVVQFAYLRIQEIVLYYKHMIYYNVMYIAVEMLCGFQWMIILFESCQVVEDGYEFFAKRQLVTLFSAPNYRGGFDNCGAVMSVDETLMASFQVGIYDSNGQPFSPSHPSIERVGFSAQLVKYGSSNSYRY